ncbi:MAG TPA: CHASE3 domain-containing protein [Gammaproteobacteria bacterium]|nr:CHASE3 domain-containing protein [Gammaproteobacteria bacterium]
MARSQAVLDALDQLTTSVMNAETGERGYLITGDRTYLQPYNSAVAAIDEEIGYLKALTEGNLDQRTNFSTLRPLITTRRTELQRSIIHSATAPVSS